MEVNLPLTLAFLRGHVAPFARGARGASETGVYDLPMTTVAILDYGSGNLRSAERAVASTGVDVVVTATRTPS